MIPIIFLWIARAATALLALACAAAAIAGQGGRWDDRLDMLNHAAPFWLLGALAALGAWAALGRSGWITPVLAVLAALPCALQIAPEFAAMARLDLSRPGAETLKVVEFNVWADNIDPGGTVHWILDQDADFVVLEEASPQILAGLHGRYPYETFCGRRHEFCSTMILSRRRPLARADKGTQTKGWATYPARGGPITIVAAHITRPWPVGAQRIERRRLALMLAHFAKARMIVAGDFNSTPWSFALQRQDKAFGLTRRTRALFSWPARDAYRWGVFPPLPLVPIDHVYAGAGWRTLSVRRGPRLGSDHYPVVVTLAAGP